MIRWNLNDSEISMCTDVLGWISLVAESILRSWMRPVWRSYKLRMIWFARWRKQQKSNSDLWAHKLMIMHGFLKLSSSRFASPYGPAATTSSSNLPWLQCLRIQLWEITTTTSWLLLLSWVFNFVAGFAKIEWIWCKPWMMMPWARPCFSSIYCQFLTLVKFLWQGLLRLNESAVQLRCREEDLDSVLSIVSSAANVYAEKAGVDPPTVFVDENHFLPGPPKEGHHGSTWYILPSLDLRTVPSIFLFASVAPCSVDDDDKLACFEKTIHIRNIPHSVLLEGML